MQGIICSQKNEETYLLSFALNNSGLEMRSIEGIDRVIEIWSDQPADFVVLVLPGSSTDLMVQVQNMRSWMIAPLVLISDLVKEEDQVGYYQAGVDLIVTRPYSLRLLPYQIRPLLLRNNSIPILGLPDLIHPTIQLDTNTRSAVVGEDAPIHLTQLEFRLLYTLMVRRGSVLTSEDIVSLVWGYSGDENRDLVRGLVQRLRAKIEPDPQNPCFILTEPGVGYSFNPKTEEKSDQPT
jgi:two-component system, OmpR family, KDP operon response regulator KdpE